MKNLKTVIYCVGLLFAFSCSTNEEELLELENSIENEMEISAKSISEVDLVTSNKKQSLDVGNVKEKKIQTPLVNAAKRSPTVYNFTISVEFMEGTLETKKNAIRNLISSQCVFFIVAPSVSNPNLEAWIISSSNKLADTVEYIGSLIEVKFINTQGGKKIPQPM